MNKKTIISVASAGLVALGLATPVLAANNSQDSDISKETIQVDNEAWVQGMVEEHYQASNPLSPFKQLYVAPGKHVRYPKEGGKWTYGFWDAKVHSNYKVNKPHGSTVVYIDVFGKKHVQRSIDTAAGRTSIAEVWAVNLPKATARYYYRVVKK